MVTATGGPDTANRLWETLEPYLEAEGVELDDLGIFGRGGGRIVRVTVDAPGGIGVDRIAELSRGVSRLFEAADPVNGAYTLEVTSPGLERSLRRPNHFEKAVGREVDVRTTEEIEGAQRHRGLLEGTDDDGIRITVDGVTRTIPMHSIAQAKTVFHLKKSPKPGAKRGNGER